ncbi:MAG: WG repeat-containing protein [Mangrovibacterium sp.]
MKKFNLFWKIVVLIIAGSSSLMLVIKCREIYVHLFGTYYDSGYFSPTLKRVDYFNGHVKLLSIASGKTVTKKMDWIANPDHDDTTTVFCRKGKRGYLSATTGEITIPAQYGHAWKFSEGLGAVVKEQKIGFINTKGELIIPYQYRYFPDKNWEVDFQFRDGFCTVVDSLGKRGLINRKGEWVLSPEYDRILNPEYGYRVVRQGDQYGLLDEELAWKLAIEYDHIKIREDGFVVAKSGAQKLIAFDTQTVIQPFVYDDVCDLHYNSGRVTDDGSDILLKSDCVAYQIHNKKGIMDQNGHVVTIAIYSEISALSNNLFSCQLGNIRITINAKGETVY